MMAHARQIPQETIRFRQGDPAWQRVIGTDMAGQTLGLIGLGRLGRKVAQYARAFDMKVLAWSRHLDADTASDQGVELASSLGDLLARSDFISIHVPLNEASRGMIGAAELARMKPSACLINTSRGPIIDEAALIEALRDGRIAGAGLDVYDQEPLPSEHPFRQMETLIATPHVGYVIQATYRLFFDGILEAIVGFLDGTTVRQLNS